MDNAVVTDLPALLQAWRDQGADRADPLRFRVLEAMARRAEQYRGAARERLEQRLSALVNDYRSTLAQAAAQDASRTAAQATDDARAPGPLSALLEHIGQQARHHEAAGACGTVPAQPGAEREPPLADYFRQTWTRVSAEREFRRSLARVPEHAGPLNSNHLIHRSLGLMRDLCPAYLEQFLSYVDALRQLEAMAAAPGAGKAGKRAR